MKAILIGILAVILLLPTVNVKIVNAEIDYTYRCSGGILIKEANFTIGSDTYELNQTLNCPYGCDANVRACRPAPVQGYIYAGIFVAVIIIAIGAIFKFG